MGKSLFSIAWLARIRGAPHLETVSTASPARGSTFGGGKPKSWIGMWWRASARQRGRCCECAAVLNAKCEEEWEANEDRRIQVRIGINLSDVILENEDKALQRRQRSRRLIKTESVRTLNSRTGSQRVASMAPSAWCTGCRRSPSAKRRAATHRRSPWRSVRSRHGSAAWT